MIPVTCFKDHKAVVFGLGQSGLVAAQALLAGGAEVLVWDDHEAARAEAAAAGLQLGDPAQQDWRGVSALVLAPGVPLTHPQPHWTVTLARQAGVPVIGDTELFCRERRHLRSRAKVAAITGTNGKSTTAALTTHLLAAAGRPVALGGNIGTAVLALAPFAHDLTYVVEYSSFQIELTPSLDADAATLLNITPDHLDRHGTLDRYAAIKGRIFARQGAGDVSVVGIDDVLSAAVADQFQGESELRRISCRASVADGVYAGAGGLIEVTGGRAQAPVAIAGVGALRGVHNWQNAAAAFALARGLGLSRREIAAGLASFPGLAHRMEEVGRLGRVLFVNDSKATNADAAAKALASFDAIYWIAGGLAKAGGLDGLDAYFPRIRRAYLIGDAAAAFGATLDGRLPYRQCGTLDAAVDEAARDALDSDAAEPVVLLSPACASYDQFRDFTVRGDAFRGLVAGLRGVTMREGQAA